MALHCCNQQLDSQVLVEHAKICFLLYVLVCCFHKNLFHKVTAKKQKFKHFTQLCLLVHCKTIYEQFWIWRESASDLEMVQPFLSPFLYWWSCRFSLWYVFWGGVVSNVNIKAAVSKEIYVVFCEIQLVNISCEFKK